MSAYSGALRWESLRSGCPLSRCWLTAMVKQALLGVHHLLSRHTWVVHTPSCPHVSLLVAQDTSSHPRWCWPCSWWPGCWAEYSGLRCSGLMCGERVNYKMYMQSDYGFRKYGCMWTMTGREYVQIRIGHRVMGDVPPSNEVL